MAKKKAKVEATVAEPPVAVDADLANVEEVVKPPHKIVYPVYRLRFPKDAVAEVARQVYCPLESSEETSDEGQISNTEDADLRDVDFPELPFPDEEPTIEIGDAPKIEFLHGEGRKLVAEAFDFGGGVDSLRAIVIRNLVGYYKGGPLPASLTKHDRILFGELLDVDLPLEKVILLINDTYWRRVVEIKGKYQFPYLKESKTVGYKKLGLNLKFTELIETTSPEVWNLDYFKELSRRLSPFITKLSINQLQSRSQLLMDLDFEKNDEYKIRNYSIDECDHGDLSFLSELRHLEELSIEFGVLDLGFDYQKRHFDFSYKDVDILSDTIRRMKWLRTLAIRRSSFSKRKIESLMRGMSYFGNVETLDLSFCQLTTTNAIAEFLSVNNALKALELKGNYLSGNEVVDLATAINEYNGHLRYLGLAQNPLQSDGIKGILSNILNTTQVNELDISACQIDADDVPCVIDFIKSHAILRSVNLTGIPLDGEINGDNLVKVVRGHYGILRLPHKSCGLSVEQEMNLRILLQRNNYYDANPALRADEVTPEKESEIDLAMKQKIHRLLADKTMPKFFRENGTEAEADIATAESNYPQNAYTENEFVERAGFY